MIEPKPTVKNLYRHRDFGSDRVQFVRLDKNERTTPFPQEAFRGMLAQVSRESITMYPDQRPLYRKLAAFWGLDASQFLLTPGSDAAIKIVYETYVSPGEQVVFLDPTYAMVEVYANMFDARKIKVGFSADLEVDFAKLMHTVSDRTRVVFVANPNQPTGTILSQQQIRSLLDKALRTDTLVVFDEAYQPFSEQESTIRLVNQYPNLVVTQTFSKGAGLASVRLGFICSNPHNIDFLFKVKTHSDINLFALKFGEYLFDNYAVIQDYVDSVKQSKQLIARDMEELGIETLQGHANFVHLRFPPGYDLDGLAAALETRGYLVRVSGSGLPAVIENCIRITVGPVAQMREFLHVFREVYSSQPVLSAA